MGEPVHHYADKPTADEQHERELAQAKTEARVLAAENKALKDALRIIDRLVQPFRAEREHQRAALRGNTNLGRSSAWK